MRIATASKPSLHQQDGTGARLRPRFVCAIAIASAALLAASAAQARPVGGGRVMAPTQVRCDPNQLTSYFGKVTGYKRGKASTWLRIATDYDTVEEVTVSHAGAKDASKQYLYQRAPFTAAHWAKIESKPGVLRPGTRATAWVCTDGKTPPLIDWNAPAE